MPEGTDSADLVCVETRFLPMRSLQIGPLYVYLAQAELIRFNLLFR